MKFKILSGVLTIFSLLIAGADRTLAQGTAFTYQGRLNSGTNPVNGSYDLKFSLFNALSGPAQVGATVTSSATAVSNGLFTVTLDFGTNFPGANRWLEISVRTNSNDPVNPAYTILSPRQLLTPTPYAIYAGNAASATTATGVSANAVTASGIQDGTITAAKLAGGQVVKTLNGLTDTVSISAGANVTLTTNGNSLQVASSGGATSGWALGGNGGTTGANFVGTTDTNVLELRVNSSRALRLEPNTSGAPNVIEGSSVNFVTAGVKGAVIGGGGAVNYSGTAYTNSVSADFSTVSGGYANSIQTSAGTSTIGGGFLNTVQTGASTATIGGGYVNTIQTNAYNSTIGGGSGNVVQQTATSSTVAGGANNIIHTGAASATVGGGLANIIQPNSSYSTISGGTGNNVANARAVVGGGVGNTASGDTSTVGGGGNNEATSDYATVPGGYNNSADGRGSFAAGINAHAAYNNSFIWGDSSQEADSTGPNRFEVLATGGISLNPGANGVNIPGSLTAGSSFTAIEGVSSGNKGVYGATSAAGPNFAGVWGENSANGGTGVVAHASGSGSTGIYAFGTGNAGFFDGNIQVHGTATVKVLTINSGADVAEPFNMSGGEMPKGAIVVIDEENTGKLKLSDRPYDCRVAGIVSGANGIHSGISLQQDGLLEGGQNVALSGRVYVLADAADGGIKPGDLLTTSATPGHAMKVTDHPRAQGAVIGKAMSSLETGKGFVLVLVTLQ